MSMQIYYSPHYINNGYVAGHKFKINVLVTPYLRLDTPVCRVQLEDCRYIFICLVWTINDQV